MSPDGPLLGGSEPAAGDRMKGFVVRGLSVSKRVAQLGEVLRDLGEPNEDAEHDLAADAVELDRL